MYSIIQQALSQSAASDSCDCLEQERVLTDKLMNMSEEETDQLFSDRTLELIFGFPGNPINKIAFHVLGLMRLYKYKFYRLKEFIDDSQEHFDLFFRFFPYIFMSDIENFYQDTFIVIKFDNVESCRRFSQYLLNLLNSKDFDPQVC